MNILGKLITYIKEVHLEVKKVNWPTRQEAIKHTLAVVAVSLAVAAFLGGVDVVLGQLLEKFIL